MEIRSAPQAHTCSLFHPAVALVDVTQHMARFSEALATLLVPHQLRVRPGAPSLVRQGASVTLENVTFAYPDCPPIFEDVSVHIGTGQRVGLVGASGAGKSTLFALVQRFYDIRSGSIRIDGQDITSVTQQSLREAIAVVPQDISSDNSRKSLACACRGWFRPAA